MRKLHITNCDQKISVSVVRSRIYGHPHIATDMTSGLATPVSCQQGPHGAHLSMICSLSSMSSIREAAVMTSRSSATGGTSSPSPPSAATRSMASRFSLRKGTQSECIGRDRQQQVRWVSEERYMGPETCKGKALWTHMTQEPPVAILTVRESAPEGREHSVAVLRLSCWYC